MTDTNNTQIRAGLDESLFLPALGLTTMKAKIDNGAKTSALNAFDIKHFGRSRPRVRFMMKPISARAGPIITFSAGIVNQREAASPNGDRTSSYLFF